jgi:hypothetical protein
MILIALIGGQNTVTGIVQIDSYDEIQMFTKIYSQVIDITNVQPLPQIGWSFDGQNIVGTSPSKKITKLAMNQRFTVPEMLGLLAYVEAQPASIVDLLLKRLEVATYIDLSRSDTQAGVGVLVQLGLITSERATVILTTPPNAYEAYIG